MSIAKRVEKRAIKIAIPRGISKIIGSAAAAEWAAAANCHAETRRKLNKPFSLGVTLIAFVRVPTGILS
jgi:hypothetical protein